MPIDAELYKQAREYYRQWNEAEQKDSIRNAGKLTPKEGWEQYRSLWEFCINLNSKGGKAQRYQKLRDLAQYYDRLQTIERWRKRDR